MRKVSRRKAKDAETAASVIPEPNSRGNREDLERAENPPPGSKAPQERIDRLAVTLREDGTIETEGMRAGTKDRLKKALSDESLGERLGLSASMHQPIAGDAFFDPTVCGVLYDTVSRLMVVIATRSGYTPEQAASVLAFTPDEKTMLAPLTGKVLDRWIPVGGKYKDETMLALALFGIVNAKVIALRSLPQTVAPPTAPEVGIQ